MNFYYDTDTPEGAYCRGTRSFNLTGVVPLGVPSVFQLGLLTSQRPQLKQDLFAFPRTISSGFLKLVGEGFGLLIHMYPHSVQAGLICMKSELLNYLPNKKIKLFARNHILVTGVDGSMGNHYYIAVVEYRLVLHQSKNTLLQLRALGS